MGLPIGSLGFFVLHRLSPSRSLLRPPVPFSKLAIPYFLLWKPALQPQMSIFSSMGKASGQCLFVPTLLPPICRRVIGQSPPARLIIPEPSPSPFQLKSQSRIPQHLRC